MNQNLPAKVKLDKNKRVLFLTKDLSLIKKQLYDGVNLAMKALHPDELLDDINTDIMTPAWVCFHHDPKEIAKRAYAGLMYQGERIFCDDALRLGGFEAIVSGKRKGTGSSRETAAQCEHASGIKYVFAESFAPIHQRNNLNLGQLMGNYELLLRLQDGEEIDREEFLAPFDRLSQEILRAGGLFAFLANLKSQGTHADNLEAYTGLTMAQKIMAPKVLGAIAPMLAEESVIAQVDGGYSHEFTTAQVHQFLVERFGPHYEIHNHEQFAAFEDHLIYADQVARYRQFMPLIEELRDLQRQFIKKNGIRDYSAKNGISPGICHEVAREDFILPKNFIQATDSHTCMGGALNAFAFGIGATEYASLLATGLAVVNVPASIRFDLTGRLPPACAAKDVMLYILAQYSTKGLTLGKVMEFGGEGMAELSIDERATLCNMATEAGAKTGICEPDQKLVHRLLAHREGLTKERVDVTAHLARCRLHL